MTIKRLEPNDAAIAVEVVRRFADEVIDASYMERFLANPANYLMVAEVEGQLAGFLLAYRLERLKQESHKMFIYELDVDAAFRRRGVGTALIHHIREIAAQEKMMNAFVFTNHANQPAVEFYKRTGGTIPNGDDLMFVYED